MHHLIVFVIEADSAEDALSEAEDQLNKLVEWNSHSIDYGKFYDDDPVGAGHSVKNWGAKVAVSNLEHEEGRSWLMRNLLIDYNEFKSNLEEAKKVIADNTPKEIYANSMLRYRLHTVYESNWVVCDTSFINFIELGDWLNDKDAKNVWIVPCDVHT